MDNGEKSKRINTARLEAYGLMLLFFALLAYGAAKHILLPAQIAFPLSPYLLPMLIGLCGTVFSAVLAARAGREGGECGSAAAQKNSTLSGIVCALIITGLGIAFVLLMKYITFMPAAALYVLAVSLITGQRRPLPLILLPLVCSAALWALMRFVFGIML